MPHTEQLTPSSPTTTDLSPAPDHHNHDQDHDTFGERVGIPRAVRIVDNEGQDGSNWSLGLYFNLDKRGAILALLLLLIVGVASPLLVLRIQQRTGNQNGPREPIGLPTPEPTSPPPSGIILSQDRWILGSVTLRGHAANVQLGKIVTLSKDGSGIAVGTTAPPSLTDKTDENPSVEVYRIQDDGNLTSLGCPPLDLTDHDGGVFFEGGLALSRNASRVAIGVVGSVSRMGSVSVFEYVFDSWKVVGSGSISGSSAMESFGSAIVMSSRGSIVAVGAPQNANNGKKDAGAVRVFQLEEDGDGGRAAAWVPMGNDILGRYEGGKFGKDLSISSDGRTLAISAIQDDWPGKGEVRVFSWINDDWEQVGEAISGSGLFEHFGFSLSLSADGNHLAIGAPFHDSRRGRVEIWRRSSAVGTYEPFGNGIPLEGKHASDRFGYSVDLSDDGMTCVIGIPMEESASGGSNGREGDAKGCCGRVVVFQYDEDRESWVGKGQQTTGAVANDQYGWKVGMSGDGNVFMASAPLRDSKENGEDSGEVRLYRLEEEPYAWEQIGQMLRGTTEFVLFGGALALSGDGTQLAVAAPSIVGGNDVVRSRYVEVYQLEGNRWVPKGKLLDGPEERSLVGVKADLSGDGSTLVLGQWKGAVQVFSFEEVSWNTTARLQIPAEEDPGGKVTTAVGLSEDGLILAAGVWSSSYGGPRAGSVTVYSRNSTTITEWSRMGSPIVGQEAGEGLGSSIALSGNGLTVAAAAGLSEERSVTDSGIVRVFTYDEGNATWTKVGQDLVGFRLEAPYSLLRIALNSDGTVVAVGSYIVDDNNNHNNGTVCIYRLSSNGAHWEQLGVSIPGVSVALRDTSDGLLLVVGVPFHDSDAPPCDNLGMIRVFVWENWSESWHQIGNDMLGEEDSDTLGSAVAISADGMIVASSGVLSRGRDDLDFSGIVRVFKRVDRKANS